MSVQFLPKRLTILDAAAADATGNALAVRGFKTIAFQFATDGGSDAALTINFQGSYSDDCPDFSAAQSKTNLWDYIEVIDLEDGSAIDGDTGISVASADDYRQFEANLSGINWICATMSSRTEGEATLYAIPFTNE